VTKIDHHVASADSFRQIIALIKPGNDDGARRGNPAGSA
jgi:hypothetical protein